MCMEDIRTMRKAGAQWREQAIDVTSRVVAGRDLHRIAVEFRPKDASQTFRVRYNGAASATMGVEVTGTSPVLRYTLAEHGQLVFGPFEARAGAAIEILVVESTVNED